MGNLRNVSPSSLLVIVTCTCDTLRFCSTWACTLLVLWQYFHISQCASDKCHLHMPVTCVTKNICGSMLLIAEAISASAHATKPDFWALLTAGRVGV